MSIVTWPRLLREFSAWRCIGSAITFGTVASNRQAGLSALMNYFICMS
jgi:hypothetical protein